MNRLAASIFITLCGFTTVLRADVACPDAGLLTGKLLTDICWSCLFPIKVTGVPIAGNGADAPQGASNKSLCLCEDNLGVPHPGYVVSMWEPARIVELVRAPGCSPALGGIRLPMSDWRDQGGAGNAVFDSGDKAFYHYHYYAFPLLVMLDLFISDRCNADGFLDFDLMYMSELDPTWNNDDLAFFTNPEAAAVATPLAQAACMADAAAATAKRPIDSLFWCAGSWGHLYPFAGKDSAAGSLAENTSLLATRATAALHRRGLARRTMGDDTLCRARIDPMLPKTQYKMSMFFPLPEANSDHVIGENAFSWGEWRMIPAVGEDALYVLWRWRDCCAEF